MKKPKGLFYAETIRGSCRIDMRFMLRNKYIVRNALTRGVMEWTKGQAVSFECVMTEKEKFLRLIYTIDNGRSRTKFDYSIQIDEVASNLGKGTILYFRCPESDKRSRILFMAYGNNKFINREYYETKHGLRIYYGCQKTSKIDYHNTRYFDLKRQVEQLEENLNKKHRNTHYRGKTIKEQKQLFKLQIKMEYHNRKRLETLVGRLKI